MPREPSGPLSTERARERRALHEGCRCGASLVCCCTSCCCYCSSSIRLAYPKAQTAEGPSRTQRLCPLRLLTLRMADLRRISTRWRTDLSRCARVSKCEARASPAPCMSCCCRPSRSLQLRLATTNLSHQPSFSCLLMHFPPPRNRPLKHTHDVLCVTYKASTRLLKPECPEKTGAGICTRACHLGTNR